MIWLYGTRWRKTFVKNTFSHTVNWNEMKNTFSQDKVMWNKMKSNSARMNISLLGGVVKRRMCWAYVLYDFSTTWFITQKLSNKSYSVWVQRSTIHRRKQLEDRRWQENLRKKIEMSSCFGNSRRKLWNIGVLVMSILFLRGKEKKRLKLFTVQ